MPKPINLNLFMTDTAYRVLARKYRPTIFADMVGQDVLVRTLTHAIESGRLAHAWLLTGIRGVGKTTTARIIARALNCIGADGKGGPTITPCGVCPNCVMIAEDRHVDVMEMDAASRTGVGDIRELIETVHYAPANARYKIYIIDEVHMLSSSAFNALLKTLEEPPPHVKFIFATTETRKIPVTILSRCQRFDLARVKMDALIWHLANVCAKESVAADTEALALIASAAEGSVRDGLSMLDQAIAHSHVAGTQGSITALLVRAMLGLTDKSQGFDLLEAMFSGDVKAAMDIVRALYDAGADPVLLLQELLALTHFITRVKLIPALAADITLSETERTRGKVMAEKLSMPVLTRAWQMLLKGLQETRHAPHTLMAVEMVLIRIMHAASLPTPVELVQDRENVASSVSTQVARNAMSSHSLPSSKNMESNLASVPLPASRPTAMVSTPRPALSLVEPQPQLILNDFEELVELFSEKKEMVLYSYLRQEARLVSFVQGKVELHHVNTVPQDFCTKIARCLADWTGSRWNVIFSPLPGAYTLSEQAAHAKMHSLKEAAEHPVVKSVIEQFPGATLTDIVDNRS